MTTIQLIGLALALEGMAQLLFLVFIVRVWRQAKLREGVAAAQAKWLAKWSQSVSSALRREPIRAQGVMDQVGGLVEDHSQLKTDFDNLVPWVQSNLDNHKALIVSTQKIADQQKTISEQMLLNIEVINNHGNNIKRLASPPGYNPPLN